ncbi:MAG: adenylate/guanylate cyclase domain-containing protein [Betaproteobacteria bacterium]|nr:adenylate/guanylate cyclase domain-containing protein [Betaproteobacteria bacterium]MCL2886884.1 adenylate/guanylate cyclase domain-containing protein [Betaproteobacteria bacterium]
MSATERKMIVMFADVSGSASLFERLGDAEAVRAVERCMKRMKRSIDGYRGRIVQIVGDELLATYESAEDACLAAIDMQQRIADLPPISGFKLTIRIGLHLGAVSESGGKLSGEAIISAARITGLARRAQILCSSALIAELPEGGTLNVQSMEELGTLPENGGVLTLSRIDWTVYTMGDYTPSIFGPSICGPLPPAHAIAESLRVRYHRREYLVDGKKPVLSIGRDLGNGMVVEDRKASRQHARIEKRLEGYFLVDTSTNGCYVSMNGRPETLIRRREIQLNGIGSISFGTSGSVPEADYAEYEHL